MKNRLVNDRYNVIVPDHIADWDAPSEWERQRFLSMEKHLKKGDTLYDIGSEQGWQSAIYAQFVGGENMVLVEPDKKAWPNIKQTWEANNLGKPRGYFVGCLGTERVDAIPNYSWPKESAGKLQTSLGYGSLKDGARQTTLDALVVTTGLKPDAITIDVEGFELDVLMGAKKTLKEVKPRVWVSVHPDLMEKNGSTEKELQDYLTDLGYSMVNLGWDGHETHWHCYHD